ncbi:hypothetical protein Droror1_Dr00008348 [Drosera rotundifolia]
MGRVTSPLSGPSSSADEPAFRPIPGQMGHYRVERTLPVGVLYRLNCRLLPAPLAAGSELRRGFTTPVPSGGCMDKGGARLRKKMVASCGGFRRRQTAATVAARPRLDEGNSRRSFACWVRRALLAGEVNGGGGGGGVRG